MLRGRRHLHDVPVSVPNLDASFLEARADGGRDVDVDVLALEHALLAQRERYLGPQPLEDEGVLDGDQTAALDEYVLGHAADADDRVGVKNPTRGVGLVEGERGEPRGGRARRNEDRRRVHDGRRGAVHLDLVRARRVAALEGGAALDDGRRELGSARDASAPADESWKRSAVIASAHRRRVEAYLACVHSATRELRWAQFDTSSRTLERPVGAASSAPRGSDGNVQTDETTQPRDFGPDRPAADDERIIRSGGGRRAA